MRELILLRHAHAESAVPGQDDADRPLSLQGQAEAEAAGRWLRDHGHVPDRVVCSTARRARETCAGAMAALGYVEQREDPQAQRMRQRSGLGPGGGPAAGLHRLHRLP